MSDAQITHSTDCWQWHHECAKRIVMELRAENERLRSELGVANDCIDLLRQDAERWRFMRANYGHMTADMLGGKLRIHVEPRRWGVVSPEDADAAIDAAMKASGSPESP